LNSGDAEILDLLLSRGGPVEARNIAGTPLVLAACKGDDSCMKVLLHHNADVCSTASSFYVMNIWHYHFKGYGLIIIFFF
jgi:ankyrin repeat protein